MVHPTLVTTGVLDESVYKQIVAFFQNKIKISELTDPAHNILNAVGGDPNQSIVALEIAEDVKERLVKEKVTSSSALSKFDLRQILNRDYTFSDIGANVRSVLGTKWQTYINNLFIKLQPSFNPEEKKLTMAKQRTQFATMVLKELRTGSSEAAVEYRKEYSLPAPSLSVSSPKTPELLLKESFDNIYSGLSQELKILPKRMVEKIFRDKVESLVKGLYTSKKQTTKDALWAKIFESARGMTRQPFHPYGKELEKLNAKWDLKAEQMFDHDLKAGRLAGQLKDDTLSNVKSRYKKILFTHLQDGDDMTSIEYQRQYKIKVKLHQTELESDFIKSTRLDKSFRGMDDDLNEPLLADEDIDDIIKRLEVEMKQLEGDNLLRDMVHEFPPETTNMELLANLQGTTVEKLKIKLAEEGKRGMSGYKKQFDIWDAERKLLPPKEIEMVEVKPKGKVIEPKPPKENIWGEKVIDKAPKEENVWDYMARKEREPPTKFAPKEIELTEIPKIEELPKELSKPMKAFLEEHPQAMTITADGILAIDMAKFVAFGKGLAAGVALTIFTDQVLDEIAKWTHLDHEGKQWLTVGVNIGISTALVMADPESVWSWVYMAGSFLSPFLSWLSEPERRAKLNDNPEKVYGSLFGKVRAIDNKTGQVRWFPAIYSSKEFKEGHGESVSVRLTYGDPKDLIWKALPDGSFKPFFKPNTWRIKNFNVTQQDLDVKKQGGREYMQKNDPLRDFYILSAEDSRKMFQDLVKGVPLSKQDNFKIETDDQSKSSPYIKGLINARNSIEFIENFNKGEDKLGVNLYPADRGLRRYFLKTNVLDSDIPDDIPTMGSAFNRAFEGKTEAILESGKEAQYMKKHGKEFGENQYLIDYFNSLTKDLIRTQHEAAKNSKGFKENLTSIKDKYGNSTWEKFYARHFNIDVNVKPAKTTEDLKKQLANVKGSVWERHYLQEKLIIRHVMSLLEERGVAKEVVDQSFASSTDKSSFKGSGNNTGLNYVFQMDAQEGVPKSLWSDSYESNIPKWFFNSKDSRIPRWNAQSQFAKELILDKIPQKAFEGVSGASDFFYMKHSRKLDRMWDKESEAEKKERLGKKKAGIVKKTRPETKPTYIAPKGSDVTNQHDPFYSKSPLYSWDLIRKTFVVAKKTKSTIQAKKPKVKTPDPTSIKDVIFKPTKPWKLAGSSNQPTDKHKDTGVQKQTRKQVVEQEKYISKMLESEKHKPPKPVHIEHLSID